MKHALFFDIDGTLLAHGEKQIRESIKKALLEAKKNDCGIFINSGRTTAILQPFLWDFPFDGYVLGCGSTILVNNKIISHHTLTHDQQDSLVNKIIELKLDAVFEGDECACFIQNGSKGNQLLEEHYRKCGFQVFDMKSERHEFNKCCVFPNSNNSLEAFYPFFSEQFEIIVRTSFFEDPFFYEVINNAYTKGTGIKEIAEYFNVPMEECYAFGDSTNDLAMLNAVKHSISMGNGDDIVKQQVEYITGSCDEDGIEQALKHYNLI